jgi:KipI family sensor histidine kinase inhibitor
MDIGMYEEPKFRPAGDRGLLVEYGAGIDPAVNQKVRSVNRALLESLPKGVREIIPAYRSILVTYDPAATAIHTLKQTLLSLEEQLPELHGSAPVVVDIPVCYEGEYGPDMDDVAARAGLTTQEVVRIHSKPEYMIYMIGFTPGFPFLGGLPESLHVPRLETPRKFVPAGSVGIANNQTGIYPLASPGGWRLIGQTPLRLFAPERSNPIPYQPGDWIRFRPISPREFHRLAAEGAA